MTRIAILGAGTMGHGIAQVAAACGYDVALSDVDEDALGTGMERLAANLAKGVEKGKMNEEDRASALARVAATTDLAEAVADADLVVEAAPERLDLKEQIFAAVDSAAPDGAVLASNTSSLSISRIAEATRRPDAVIGMHFFNPPYALKLLELVRGEQTSDATTDAARAHGERMGREIITVTDSPGFATSRLGLVLGLEAIRMVEQGVASPEDIDTAMAQGYGHPMGPLRLTDLVGLDVRLAIAEGLFEALGTDAFRPPDLLRQMVEDGRLGRKSGRGFYDWD